MASVPASKRLRSPVISRSIGEPSPVYSEMPAGPVAQMTSLDPTIIDARPRRDSGCAVKAIS